MKRYIIFGGTLDCMAGDAWGYKIGWTNNKKEAIAIAKKYKDDGYDMSRHYNPHWSQVVDMLEDKIIWDHWGNYRQ